MFGGLGFRVKGSGSLPNRHARAWAWFTSRLSICLSAPYTPLTPSPLPDLCLSTCLSAPFTPFTPSPLPDLCLSTCLSDPFTSFTPCPLADLRPSICLCICLFWSSQSESSRHGNLDSPHSGGANDTAQRCKAVSRRQNLDCRYPETDTD